jgi:excisionase family DNA binding protein
MTTQDVAAALGVSRELIHKLRRLGQLPAARTPGGIFVFLTRDVEAFRRKRAKAPRQGGKVTRGFVRVPPPEGRGGRHE